MRAGNQEGEYESNPEPKGSEVGVEREVGVIHVIINGRVSRRETFKGMPSCQVTDVKLNYTIKLLLFRPGAPLGLCRCQLFGG